MSSHSTCVTCWQFSQYVCVLVMFSHSMCMCWQFYSMCVYWLCSPTACVCAGSFTVCVCTSCVLPQHMYVLAVLQYVRVLVMLSHSTCMCWQFRSMCLYWSWSPKACACASSFTVHGYNGYGLCRHTMCWHGLLQHNSAAGNDSCISSVALCHPNMFVMRHTVT